LYTLYPASVKTLYTVVWETGCQPGVFETSAAILAHDHPLVVEFLVIVWTINKAVAVKVLSLLEWGALSI
jgi:hypothetical protein